MKGQNVRIYYQLKCDDFYYGGDGSWFLNPRKGIAYDFLEDARAEAKELGGAGPWGKLVALKVTLVRRRK